MLAISSGSSLASESSESVGASVPGAWTFCGRPVASPLGIAAGPLLNGRWLLYYAALGFDVLTYKTVRSVELACYPMPNLQPVRCGQIDARPAGCDPIHPVSTSLPACDEMLGSWAVSFGMPSKSPDAWRADVEQTRRQLPAGKILSVSVVGTVQPGWTIDDLADDYAQCARWAVDSGADCVETNFSCPNVATCDGQLYQQPRDAALVAARVRQAIGHVPLAIKVGCVESVEAAGELLDAVGSIADAVAMTNSVATTVAAGEVAAAGVAMGVAASDASATGGPPKLLFDGQRRGICGDGIRTASIRQVGLFARLKSERRLAIELIGVGGIGAAQHVREYLSAGAESVHLATAAMVDPAVGLTIRRSLAAMEISRP
jgi:dihydroorotate dehydrogenase